MCCVVLLSSHPCVLRLGEYIRAGQRLKRQKKRRQQQQRDRLGTQEGSASERHARTKETDAAAEAAPGVCLQAFPGSAMLASQGMSLPAPILYVVH